MDYIGALKLLQKKGQEQLLEYYSELSEEEKLRLLQEIENLDFDVIENYKSKGGKPRGNITPLSQAVSVHEARTRQAEFKKAGLEMLSNGKVAAVLLAGGQGSRLGFNGPKGTFNIGITRKLSIFEQQMNNIKKVTAEICKPFHLFIMTSRGNNDDTVKFFKDNNYFDYPGDKVHFFIQDVAPTCDYNGKIFLDGKGKISLAPNGNGGWYSSLVKSGLNKIIEEENIEWLNVYSVDNVLQRICDPAFIGATMLKNCRCGAKVVKKAYPDEKVGVLCLEDGRPSIIEYFEMSDEMKNERINGELVYCYGVILNYLFNVEDLNGTLAGKLPYHVADKAIAHIENGERVTPDKPCGYKFETLAVDIVNLMESCLAYEVVRENEFAPVKNSTGIDSVESARDLLVKNGVVL